jgi:hypothetical protein
MSELQQAPLEDLMAAMDVVDTLRHQRDIAAREFDADNRRERLLERLKTLYRAQGIDVPEHVLQEGIDALEQERFEYHPVVPSWRTKLANVWVSRGRWGKPLGFIVLLAAAFSGIYIATEVLPQSKLRAELPNSMNVSVQRIHDLAKNPAIIDEAESLLGKGSQLLEDGELDQVQAIDSDLSNLLADLQRAYIVRVISRPRESSGVWRVPDANEASRNYYLIVEAIDKDDNVVSLNILSEETNKRSEVKTWGIRVNQETFYKVAADKNDDGIIQRNQVGEKLAGYLQPVFSIPTSGGTITNWD